MLKLESYQILSDKFIDFCPLNSFYFGGSESVSIITKFQRKTVFNFDVTC